MKRPSARRFRCWFKHELRLATAIASDKYLYSRQLRVNGHDNVAPRVIVSLTSFPQRFTRLNLVLYSLLRQAVAPEKVVLYLSDEELKGASLPRNIAKAQNRGIEIKIVSQNLRPYNKLIHALRDYPDYTIISVDDDRLYRPSLVADLLNGARANPGCVICGLRRQIRVGNDGSLLPYREWPHIQDTCGLDVMALGYSGVLYPPGSLHEDVTRTEIFTTLAPTTDDLWFKVMATLNSTPIVSLNSSPEAFSHVSRQTPSALWKHNQHGVNDINMAGLMRYYGISPEHFLPSCTSSTKTSLQPTV
jgi:hypothetical protein